MSHLRRSVLVLIACSLHVGACTFGMDDTAPTDAGSGGIVEDAGTASGGAGGSGGRVSTGGARSGGATSSGGSSAGGSPNGGMSGATSGGAGGTLATGGAGGTLTTGGTSSGGTEAGAGGAGTGGVEAGAAGAGGSLVDAAPDRDASPADASSEAGSACGPCPAGQYCDAVDRVCRPGCGSGSACASGSCAASHDCNRCVSDSECSAGHICSTGVCLPPCASTQDCPNGYECCGNRCADLTKDYHHCASCSADCASDDYCSSGGCKATSVAGLCDTPHVTLLLDGAPVDDTLSAEVATALVAQCPTAPVTATVPETATVVINPLTGQPVAGAGDLVVELGGPFSQKVTRYIESAGLTRVHDRGGVNVIGFYGRATDGGVDPVIAEAPYASLTANHDFFKIEISVDPVSGTRVLQVYGLFAPGTAAAEWFLLHRVLPNLSTYNLHYYVYEWTHGDGGTNPGANDSFALVASGN